MRRLVALVLVGSVALAAGAVALGSGHRAAVLTKIHRAVALGSSHRSANSKLQIFRNNNAAVSRLFRRNHPPTLNVPAPAISGYACPVAATGPCPTTPCTLYIQPQTTVVVPQLNGIAVLPPQPRSRSCRRQQAHAIPAMAR